MLDGFQAIHQVAGRATARNRRGVDYIVTNALQPGKTVAPAVGDVPRLLNVSWYSPFARWEWQRVSLCLANRQVASRQHKRLAAWRGE